MFKRLIITFILFFSFALLFLPNILLAQSSEKIGFSLSPYSFEYDGMPGQVISGTLRVENINSEKINIIVEPESLVAFGQDGQVAITEEDPTFSLKNWITISNPRASVKPKEFAYFDFKLNIPVGTDPGSHYGALSVSFAGDVKPKTSTGADIIQKSSAIILLRIPGDVKEELNLVYFQPEKFFYTDPKFKLSALFENKGTVNLKPFGEINIFDIWGNKIKSIKVAGKNILPDKKRIFEEEFDMEDISYFRAELNMFYGSSQQKTIFAQTNFVGINWPVLSKYLLILLAVIVFYIIFRKRINKAVKILLKGDK